MWLIVLPQVFNFTEPILIQLDAEKIPFYEVLAEQCVLRHVSSSPLLSSFQQIDTLKIHKSAAGLQRGPKRFYQ